MCATDPQLFLVNQAILSDGLLTRLGQTYLLELAAQFHTRFVRFILRPCQTIPPRITLFTPCEQPIQSVDFQRTAINNGGAQISCNCIQLIKPTEI